VQLAGTVRTSLRKGHRIQPFLAGADCRANQILGVGAELQAQFYELSKEVRRLSLASQAGCLSLEAALYKLGERFEIEAGSEESDPSIIATRSPGKNSDTFANLWRH
jgi:hypothetical protein